MPPSPGVSAPGGLRLVPTRDGATWDRLVRETPAGTAFHAWAWLELQSELLGLPIQRFLVVDGHGGDRPLGVFPVPRHRGSPSSPSLPFPFLGPVVPAAALGGALAAYRRWQWRHGLALGRFELGPDLAVTGVPALSGAGMVGRPQTTVVVPTAERTAAQLREAYGRSHRKSLRRAERAGVTVRASQPGEVAELLPRLLTEAFGVRGVPSPFPTTTGARVEEWASGREDVRLATALVGDQPAGVLVGLGGAPVHVAWAGGCLREFRDAAPNVPLYDDVLAWGVARGARSVDLAGEVDAGVLRFKLGFGGEERGYLTAESFLGPAATLRLARAAVTRVAGLRG